MTLLLFSFLQVWADTWTDGNGITWSFTVKGTEAMDIRPSGPLNYERIYLYGDPKSSDLQLPFQPEAWIAAAMRFSDIDGQHFPSLSDEIYWGFKTLIIDVSDVTDDLDVRVMSGWWENFNADGSETHVHWNDGLNEFQLTEDIAKICAGGNGGKNHDLQFMVIDGSCVVNSVYYEDGKFEAPEVVIPSKVYVGLTELNVTSIGDNAFSGCSGLTSVTIPESVTSIGAGAFSSCSSLTSVTIPSSVTSIGAGAFFHCSSLTSMTIPEGVTSVGSSAFSYCSGLTSVTIPSSVTSIGTSTFSGCSSLTSVTIPSSVTSIGNDAFSYCTGLSTITMEGSVPTLGEYAVPSLTSIYVPIDYLTDYHAADVWKNMADRIYSTPNVYTEAEGLTWRFSVYGDDAIILGVNSCCENLVIPSVVYNDEKEYTVTCIGASAFQGCTNLVSAFIPEGVTSIVNGAFNNCSSLMNVTIPSSVTSIGSSAFSGCSGLTSVTIPEGVTSISSSVFSGCSSMTSVTIPEGVTSIGGSAFQGCSGLTSVTIPSSVTSIGGSAFQGCSGLTSVTIPEGVTSLGWYVFSGCTSLTSVALPNSMTRIGGAAFEGCRSLTSITIPNSVTCIDQNAFWGCSGLTSITIPNSVTTIGIYAFSGCTGLTSVTIPNSVTKLGSTYFLGDPFGNPFSDCSSLSLIIVESGNSNYDSRDDCNAIIDKNVKTLIAGCKNTIIPNSVTRIGYDAFSGCSGLTSVTIPSSVTSIGSSAFYGCSGLTSVTIPSSVTSIGSSAFSGCSGLTSVTIPSSVTSIGSYAFSGCSSLTSVYFYKETPPTIDNSTFFEPARTTLYVPEGSMAAYQSAAYWKDFKLITTINDTDYSNIDNTIYLEPAEALTGSQVTLSVKMKNTIDVQGYQFDLYLPEGVTVATDEDGFNLIELSTERTTARRTDYFNSTVQADGSIRVLCGSSKGYTFEGNDGEVATIRINISGNMTAGGYPIILKEVNLTDRNSTLYTTDYLKTTLTVKDHVLGDVNGNRKVEVADFVATANYILGNPPQVFNMKAADVNGNNKIEVADFIGIANIILNGSGSNNTPAATPKKSPRKAATDISTLTDVIYVEPVTATPGTQQTLSIQMKNSSPVAGFEFRLQLPEGITVATDDDDILMAELSTERTTARKTDYFNSALQADGTLQVLCGTSTANPNTGKPYTFSGNKGEVARITVNIPEDYSYGMYDVRATGVVISDANANILLLDNTTSNIIITSKTTSITNYDYELQNDDIWYTLNGQKLDKKPTKKGVYIVNGKRIVIK